MIVYKATFSNNKVYIGITSKSLKRRISQHKSNAKKNSPYKFHRAMNKYGFDSIDWEILNITTTWEETQKLEKSYIQQLDTFKNGYNMTLGGDGQLGNTFKHTEEAKKKISENNFWTGRKRIHSEETKKKIGDAQRGKSKQYIVSVETRKKLSKQKLGKNNPMYGKKPGNYKGLIQVINKQTNQIIGTFSGQLECSKFLNLSQTTISNYLRHKSINKNYKFICIGDK